MRTSGRHRGPVSPRPSRPKPRRPAPVILFGDWRRKPGKKKLHVFYGKVAQPACYLRIGWWNTEPVEGVMSDDPNVCYDCLASEVSRRLGAVDGSECERDD